MSDKSTAPPPPPPLAVPDGGDENRAASLVAIYWVEGFLAITIVSLRMYARYLTKNYGWDDWTMVITLFFQIVLAAFVTTYAMAGGTRHLYYLKPNDMFEVLKWSYAFQCWGIFACTPAKLSVALLINRIMRPFRGWRFWVLVVSITLMIIINTLDSIFTYVQCDPPKALWDKTITDAKCWHPSIQTNISIAQAAYNVFVDGILAVIPATILWSLQMPIKQKICLCILLGLGLFAAVAGSIKTSLLANLGKREDLTWEMYELIIWAGTENFVVLFCGCIPPLKPLWDKLMASGNPLKSLHFSHGTRNRDRGLIEGQKENVFEIASKSSVKSSVSVPIPPNTQNGTYHVI
ncbi:hypothetical protein BS50DRAFT_618472 [Corynespora cassiicola Philippines]|uniref:Rhodopsin domain-containing protein n=1 Tax=Corynespora cassiicola Philippines TaxID=1448308 RepID=A0A2T2P1A4_CORCC|nr:hypothetical protein BS50DRAFT_618472 [Corynespora cassiicola Philippines]